jgi:hypothetical protein
MSTDTPTAAQTPLEAVLTANDLSDPSLRLGLAAALGESGFQERDRYEAFGWEIDPSEEEYAAMYLRNPYGGGLIDKAAQLAWRHAPEIEDTADQDDTAFEDQVAKLARNLNIWTYLNRTQRAAGFGEYALLFIDFDDVDDLDNLDEEVSYGDASLDNIRGFRVIPQFAVDEVEHGDFGSTRWGEPEHYTIDWGEDINDDLDETAGSSRVHHSRVVEVPSKPPLTEEYSSRPRMERILNTLYDIEKLIGSAAEMAYRGADKGLHINWDPTKVDPNSVDDDGTKSHVREWYHGLQPTLNTVGADVTDLGGEISDPTGALDAELKSLSAATGFSKQFIEGAAAGEIASSETNMRNDFGEIRERQQQYVGPYLVRRGLEVLMEAGILERPEGGDFDISWPDLFELSDEEEATIEQKRSQTAKNLGMMGPPAQEYVAEGEFPDDEPAPMTPVDEANPAVANQFDALGGDSVTANATVTMDPDIPERYLEEFGEDAFVPPEAAQEKAQRILDLRDDEDVSVNGGTDTGWRRAEQLAAGGPVPPEEVRQIDAWFSRHPKSEADYDEDAVDHPAEDNGWTARMLWGWDAAQRWAGDLAPRLRDFEDEQTDNLSRRDVLEGGSLATANATQYVEGDTVQSPQGLGVVVEVRTEEFEGKNGETVEASSGSPTYAVGLKDARVGVGFYKASQLSAAEMPETPVDDPVGDVQEDQSANSVGDRVLGALNLRSNDWTMPRSWRESDTPARLILLDAWASMGGQFDCAGGCCMSELKDAELCAAMKDEVLGGWTGWRDGGD